jgi:hypothetical protein
MASTASGTDPAALAIFYFANSDGYPQKIQRRITIIDVIGAEECYIPPAGQNGAAVSLGIVQLPMQQGQHPDRT